jgi:hypothetical protein
MPSGGPIVAEGSTGSRKLLLDPQTLEHVIKRQLERSHPPNNPTVFGGSLLLAVELLERSNGQPRGGVGQCGWRDELLASTQKLDRMHGGQTVHHKQGVDLLASLCCCSLTIRFSPPPLSVRQTGGTGGFRGWKGRPKRVFEPKVVFGEERSLRFVLHSPWFFPAS